MFDGSEPEAEPLLFHIMFELTMYAISDKCGLTHLICLFVPNEVAYHPFTGVGMVSDEIPIVYVFVHVLFM